MMYKHFYIVSFNYFFTKGGWRDRKKIDPKLVYSLLDHWLFAWLPTSIRQITKCGINFDHLEDSNHNKEV